MRANRIYIIYMGSCRAKYSYIAASTSDLVRPRSQSYIAVYSPPRPHIYITYIDIYTQKLLPTFLWVLKFDVKLGWGNTNFEITLCT